MSQERLGRLVVIRGYRWALVGPESFRTNTPTATTTTYTNAHYPWW